MRRRGRDLTDPQLRGRNLGFFGNLFDNREDLTNRGGLQSSGQIIPPTTNAPTEYTIDTDEEDNLEPTMSATNRGSADPPPQRLPPLSHNQLHSESHLHQNQNHQDGATPEMTHNLSSGEKSSGGGVIAMSNERPTYDGKQNDSHKIIDKVVDALSDAMTQFLLKDKRRFLKSNIDIGSVIPTSLGGSVKEMTDNAGFLTAFASNPTQAIFGAGVSALRRGIDATEGTNVFEELGRDRSAKVAQIGMYRGVENFVHTMMGDGQKPVDKAKHYLVAEANGATQGTKILNRMKLSSNQSEEMVFIKNPVIIPYIILSVVFYKAHHSSRNPLEHRGIMRDYLLKKCLKEVLQNVLGLPLEASTFAIDVLTNIPPQLITAYQRNISKLTDGEGVNPDEVNAINNFAKFVFSDYQKIYKQSFQKAVKSFQGQHIDILFLLNNLDKARVLNDMANQIETADNIIWEAQNNQGLFLGLLELAGVHSRGGGDERLDSDDVLDNYLVDGIVYYIDNNSNNINNKPTTLRSLMDIERNGGKGKIKGDENAGIYQNGDDYVLAIKGSELPKDLKSNFSNIAGSLGDTDRYKQAEALLKTALSLADKSGGSVAISGFSLGAKIAMELASHYHSVEADVYDPVISSGMEKLFSTIGDNINFNVVENSPISQNIFKYAKMFNLPVKTFKKKRVSSHSILNFV